MQATRTDSSPMTQIVDSVLQDTTPVRLRFLLAAICIGTGIFFAIAAITITQHENAIRTLGFDAAPSVISAHQIKIGLEAMDADLAAQLLMPPHWHEAGDLNDDFETNRTNVARELVGAAKNITYGESERVPLENMEIAIGEYYLKVQKARDVKLSDADYLPAYREALATLRQKLIPAADALSEANSRVLEETYAREKGASALSRGLVMVTGLLLIALLIYVQIYLRMRFRRRLSLPFMVGTVVAALFLQHISASLAASSNELRVAKEDSYNSVLALLDARANAFDAHAAELRWALDSANAPEHEKQYLAKISSVARFADGHSFTDTIATAQRQLDNDEKYNLPGFKGSLADELNNIRFPGEAQAALDALRSLSEFCDADTAFRQAKNSLDKNQFIALATGYSKKSPGFEFSQFDETLTRALKINNNVLQDATAGAAKELNLLVISSFLVSLAIVICAYRGLRPRLAEYQTTTYLHKRL